ncbi:PREDICTED: sorting nexin-31, partial [Nestor notabilis]|uniref:sorting nexin-31 n=1 Tax=Nestor notabilis TaxID=176057 RepID=UPI0005236AAA
MVLGGYPVPIVDHHVSLSKQESIEDSLETMNASSLMWSFPLAVLQLRQLFESAVPAFPPKFYLAMTKSMADERQSQLEQYLQNVTLDSNIANSDVFRVFFRKLQQKLKRSHDGTEQAVSQGLVKKLAEFELAYVSLQSMKELHCKLGIRKWYMDPSLDILLMDYTASPILLYMQFLELIREMQFCGYVRLDPCICDYPEGGCSADIYVSNNEIHCCIKLPTNQTKEVSFKIDRLRSWQVTFLSATKDGEDTLELRFEYNDSGTWQWIIFYTKQAFLLSSCLKKMISEQMMKAAKEGQEMEMKMPESTTNSKKSSIQQKQVVHSGFRPKKRVLVRPNEHDSVAPLLSVPFSASLFVPDSAKAAPWGLQPGAVAARRPRSRCGVYFPVQP